MTKPEERRRELCLRMRRLSDFKGRPPQVPWRPAALAYTDSSIEGPLHRPRDQLTVIHGLEKRQLQLDSRHCQPIDEDNALQAGQNHH